jgi:hypothetical protein
LRRASKPWESSHVLLETNQPKQRRAKDEVHELKRENQELRRKLEAAEKECRLAVQAWAKTQITKEELAQWELEIKKGVKGGSLIELIRQLEKEI